MNDTWTHAAARWTIRPLVGTGVTPNHLTTARLLTGVGACVCIALGTPAGFAWGGTLWLLSAFLDRADGELARVGDMMSEAGHRYDYQVDMWVNSGFFIAAGLGARRTWLGHLAPLIGLEAAVAMVACWWLAHTFEVLSGPGVKTWKRRFGFDADDGLYLLGPIVWLGWLGPILIPSAVCSTFMAVVTLSRLLNLKRRRRRIAPRTA